MHRDSILFDESRTVATISSGLPEKKACVDQADDEPDRVGDEDGNHGCSGAGKRRSSVDERTLIILGEMSPVSPVIPIEIDEKRRLEPLEAVHADSIFELVDRDRDRLGGWLPWVAKTLATEDSLAFIEDSKRRRDLDSGGDGSGDWAIVLDEGGSTRIVGVIGLHDSSPANRRIAIGYWVNGEDEGGGHVTTATRAVTTRCFEAGFHRVEIRVRTDNVRSRAVAERLGFQFEGVMRAAEWVGEASFDHAVFARIATP